MSAADALHLVLFAAISLACVSAWGLIFSRLLEGREIIPYEPRTNVSWNLRDVVLIGLAGVVLVVLCGGAISAVDDASRGATESADEQKPKSGPDPFGLIIATSMGNLLAFGAACMWLRSRGAARTDLGFDFRRAGYDFQLGGGAFAAASIPIFILQWALSYLIPPSHAVSDIFESHPGSSVLWATGFFAVIVAPVTEEFFFRVVLQGWLESFYAGRWAQLASEDLALERPAIPPPPDVGHSEVHDPAPIDSPAEPRTDAIPPAFVPASVSPELQLSSPPRTHMPVLISSFIFGAVHFGAGPSPIPLFFFALALGYLYRQTHRLLPSVVAHMCLNTLSTLMLATGAGQ